MKNKDHFYMKNKDPMKNKVDFYMKNKDPMKNKEHFYMKNKDHMMKEQKRQHQQPLMEPKKIIIQQQ